jgi:8-oxo-dGTP pyrophosphatase MutT (NUDIX family)
MASSGDVVIETMAFPKRVGEPEPLYRDHVRQISRVVAEFDGFTKEYFVSDSGQRAAVLAVRNDEVLFVRQYRLLINGLSMEVPGGKVEEGESPESSAMRECLEETGVQCSNLKPLMNYQLSLDVSRNPTYVYYSKDILEMDIENPERRIWVPLARCIQMVFAQEIQDTLSVISLLSYSHMVRQSEVDRIEI